MLLAAKAKKTLIYGCASNQKCYETQGNAGVLVHAISDCMNTHASTPVTVNQLKEHVKRVIKTTLDQKRHPQTPEFQCMGGIKPKSDDFKQQLGAIDRVLIIAADAGDMPKLKGIRKGVYDICSSLLPHCKPDARVTIVTDDPMLANHQSIPDRTQVIDTQDLTWMNLELLSLKENKGGSLVVTMCHGQRVKDSSEDDGFSCNLHIGEHVVPDSILTDTIAGFEGHTFIGVFEHCHAKELGDQGFARVVARSIRDDKLSGNKHCMGWALGKLLTYFAPSIGLLVGPALLPLGCMMAPILVLIASLVCSNYSYILA